MFVLNKRVCCRSSYQNFNMKGRPDDFLVGLSMQRDHSGEVFLALAKNSRKWRSKKKQL